MAAHSLASPRFRFNSGFHDGASNRKAGREPMWRKPWGAVAHFDKIYVEGYVAGEQAVAAGEYNESSKAAWKARRAK